MRAQRLALQQEQPASRCHLPPTICTLESSNWLSHRTGSQWLDTPEHRGPSNWLLLQADASQPHSTSPRNLDPLAAPPRQDELIASFSSWATGQGGKFSGGSPGGERDNLHRQTSRFGQPAEGEEGVEVWVPEFMNRYNPFGPQSKLRPSPPPADNTSVRAKAIACATAEAVERAEALQRAKAAKISVVNAAMRGNPEAERALEHEFQSTLRPKSPAARLLSPRDSGVGGGMVKPEISLFVTPRGSSEGAGKLRAVISSPTSPTSPLSPKSHDSNHDSKLLSPRGSGVGGGGGGGGGMVSAGGGGGGGGMSSVSPGPDLRPKSPAARLLSPRNSLVPKSVVGSPRAYSKMLDSLFTKEFSTTEEHQQWKRRVSQVQGGKKVSSKYKEDKDYFEELNARTHFVGSQYNSRVDANVNEVVMPYLLQEPRPWDRSAEIRHNIALQEKAAALGVTPLSLAMPAGC